MSSSSWIPRLSNNLKELRIHLSQTRPGSKGTRDFILKQFSEIRKANPALPILVREAGFVEARAFGRYEMGQERKVVLENLDEAEVAKKLQELADTKPSLSQH
ncbi:ndufa2, NADH:ubiquinone oxidoreductase 10.5kD subunit [Dinochytrium kinnereticum]|nr:ndufa2, NADH:ubiquinone oxidoreductase 10.5kD subunit [Dinochytrium kinnereticum]